MVVLGGESTGMEHGVVTRELALGGRPTPTRVDRAWKAIYAGRRGTGAVAEVEVLEVRARTQVLPVVRAVVGAYQRSPE